MKSTDALTKLLSEAGQDMNFSVAIYENQLNREKTRLAKRVAKQFLEGFAKFCIGNNLELTCGFSDLPIVGDSVYLAVSEKQGDTLMVLATPNNIIEVPQE